MSDREKAGLRGPVKRCVELQDSDATIATTTEYGRAGRLISRSSGTGESGWEEKYTYAADGRLLKMSQGKTDGPKTEQVYSYEEAGRLTGVSNATGPGAAAKFEYDENGRKGAVYTAAPKRKDKGVDYAMSPPDGSDQAFENAAVLWCAAYEACASTKILYNEHDRPTEARLRDAEGNVVSRLVRTFDDRGNVTAERQVNERPELMVPAELKEQLNPAQMKSIGKVFAAMGGLAASYAYDAQNRVKEMQRDDITMGREVTTIAYNEHGDKASEKVVRSGTEGFSGSLNEDGTIMPGPPSGGMPPQYSETRYTYDYDSYGNWTEQKVEMRSKPDEPFRASPVRRRRLSYYAGGD